ncbi:Nitrogenase iron-molybdenum cofactor biosynthesis nifE [Gossypium arboreum]|uniref:Nitrogenase iron-molybdenum cofactor biosynthesis nifE n=1 Tax=Gossypium arboreum TaxID=29729 RepID=A0A0B0MM20_GOSAR|nr:Nitrogenase iron-molybdenum cofactor biosynthesis nifE [Gossypium arboreum]
MNIFCLSHYYCQLLRKWIAIFIPSKSIGGVLLPKSIVKFERYLIMEIVSVGVEVGKVEPRKKVDLGTDTRHVFCKESYLLAEVD